MKEKIFTFMIGFLIGAILATSGFLIYTKAIKKDVKQPEMMQMKGNGQMDEPPTGNMGESPVKQNNGNGGKQQKMNNEQI